MFRYPLHMFGSWLSWVDVLPFLVGAVAAVMVGYLSRRQARRAEGEERARVARLLFEPDFFDTEAPLGGSEHEEPPSVPFPGPEQPPEPRLPAPVQQPALLPGTRAFWQPPPVEEAHFTRLLGDYYAFALVQARRHSLASLGSAVIGVGFVIAGAVYGFTQASEPGAVEIAGIVSLAGAITNGVSVLVHRQSNRALEHMENQTKFLRQDMKANHDADQAVHLLRDIEDEDLRDHLRAAVVLQLSRATLPDLPGRRGKPAS